MRKQIVIYSDEGVGPASLRYLISSLKRHPSLANYPIVRFGHRQLKEMLWQKDTALLIFPGGRDRHYQRFLCGTPNRLIREYVKQGGCFFGICAGGYYGCQSISFEKGGKLEIVEDRELAFFPGVASGPVYGNGQFCYNSERGARIACVEWTEPGVDYKKQYVSYFNGGCEFVGVEKYENVKVLARYEDIDNRPAAIVECGVGEGRAILSGVHPEYDPIDFHLNDPYLQAIGQRLAKVDHLRKPLFDKLLSKCLQF